MRWGIESSSGGFYGTTLIILNLSSLSLSLSSLLSRLSELVITIDHVGLLVKRVIINFLIYIDPFCSEKAFGDCDVLVWW